MADGPGRWPLRAGSGAFGLVPLNSCPVPTDQRGVSRPQGTRGDAGAYEFAPPSIAAPAASAGQRSSTIGAMGDPNLNGTKVLVRYGRTTAYVRRPRRARSGPVSPTRPSVSR